MVVRLRTGSAGQAGERDGGGVVEYHRSRCLSSLLAIVAVWLGLAADAAAQGSVATDRAVLEALYDATGGAGWTDSTNWKTSAPLGEWHGVTTDASGPVTELRLLGNELAGAIPDALGDHQKRDLPSQRPAPSSRHGGTLSSMLPPGESHRPSCPSGPRRRSTRPPAQNLAIVMSVHIVGPRSELRRNGRSW